MHHGLAKGCFPLALMICLFLPAIRTQAAPPVDDPLARPVTVERERIFLGELLESVSKQCGATLHVESRTPESAEPLCIVVREMPARTVMDLLVSLYSYKRARWSWVSEPLTAGEGMRYTFTPSTGAKSLIGQLDDWQMRAYAKQLEMYKKSRGMSAEELALIKDDEGILPPYPLAPVTRGKADLFMDSLTDAQRFQVIRGENRIQVPVDQIGAAGRGFLDGMHAQEAKALSELPENIPPPPPCDWVGFDRTTYPGYATSDIRVSVGDRIGYTSHTVLGGKRMNAVFKKYLLNLWLSPEEAPDDPASARPVPPSSGPDALPPPQTAEAALFQIARKMNIPLVCRSAHRPFVTTDSGIGKPLAPFLADLNEKAAYMSKWNAGALLVSTSTWHLPEEAGMRVGWEDVKGVQETYRKPKNVASVPQLCTLAARLTRTQLTGLSIDWPVFAHIARSHPIFALCGSSPLITSAMCSERGYALLPKDIPALMQLPAFSRLAGSSDIRFLRIIEGPLDPVLHPTGKVVDAQVKGSDGTWRYVASFTSLPLGERLGQPSR